MSGDINKESSDMVAKEDSISSPARPVVPETVTQAVGTEAEFIGPKNKPKDGPDVVDLTNDNPESDIQKAIFASLRDTQPSQPASGTGTGILGGQVTREEQDISRALEQSLEENKAGTKRKRGDLWFVDPLNPHERKRQENWPVGLKNVGNTCWFSAVIQSLFHLPIFRQLVINFVCPPDIGKDNSIERRHLRFMQELRQLFALMVASHRKYVDPSRSVEILKEAFSTGESDVVDSQQDVSEFQHKLLDWLEDAFKSEESRAASPTRGESSVPSTSSPSMTETSPRPSANPMVQLFYGEYLAEGINEGKSFRNKDRFGQFPLQVNGFQDIHKSLDGATARGEIETVSSDVTSKSGQEIWFTRLPPVLTFELSRFQFNQRLGKPEKIHNKLDFPELIYMDRYMECNKYITRQKREEMKKLKEELVQLQSRLDRFVNYGSGPKRFPLQDVLKYTLEFAESGSPPKRPAEFNYTDVEMESPSSQHSVKMDSPEPVPSTSTSSPHPLPQPQSPPPMGSPSQVPTTPSPRVPQCFPAPKDISRGELQVLQGCLQRWRKEVETTVKELQSSICHYETIMEAMYKDGELQKHPYRLHAVLVHEGQAASGHYWAYVLHTQSQQKWLKFNDITASETQWEEVQRESSGGFHNTSAYCLMYVNAADVEMFDDCEVGQSILACLPLDLQKYVQEDNDRFQQEIEEWDAEMLRKRMQPQGPEPELQIIEDPCPSDQPSTSSKATSTTRSTSLVNQHAELACRDMQELIKLAVSSEHFTDGSLAAAQKALIQVYEGEIKRLSGLARSLKEVLPFRDPRLQHMVVYLLANGADHNKVIKQVLLEQFLYIMHFEKEQTFRKQEILKKASFELEDVKKQQTEGDVKEYQNWHLAYSQFRKMTQMFLYGLEAFHGESYLDALPYISAACDMNNTLVSNRKVLMGMDPRIPQYYRRQCLTHVNDAAMQSFEADEDIEESLGMMTGLVLPCLNSLACTELEEDQTIVEEARNKWCLFLGLDLPETKMDKLRDFLSKLFEPPVESRTTYHHLPLPHERDSTPLWTKYEILMDIADKNGYLDGALGGAEKS